MSVDRNARRFANVTEIQKPLVRLRLGRVEIDRVARRASKALGVFIVARGPAGEILGVVGSGKFRSTFNEFDMPRAGDRDAFPRFIEILPWLARHLLGVEGSNDERFARLELQVD